MNIFSTLKINEGLRSAAILLQNFTGILDIEDCNYLLSKLNSEC